MLPAAPGLATPKAPPPTRQVICQQRSWHGKMCCFFVSKSSQPHNKRHFWQDHLSSSLVWVMADRGEKLLQEGLLYRVKYQSIYLYVSRNRYNYIYIHTYLFKSFWISYLISFAVDIRKESFEVVMFEPDQLMSNLIIKQVIIQLNYYQISFSLTVPSCISACVEKVITRREPQWRTRGISLFGPNKKQWKYCKSFQEEINDIIYIYIL